MRRWRLFPSRIARLSRRSLGQSLIMVALALVVLLGFVGLAVDSALVFAARRDLVKITDAASLAAAGALSGRPDESDALRQERARARARQYALLHGLDPATAPCWSVEFPEWPRKLVRVRACQRVPLAFMPVLGRYEVIVRAGPLGPGNPDRGQEAEAAPLDIVLVQDVSASQCYTNYNEPIGPEGWCSELLRNPPSASPRFLRPYNPTQPTTANEWCLRSGGSPHPCCRNLAGQWIACPPGQENTSPVNVPWDPFAFQQDAARYFVNQLDPRHDRIAVVSFSSRVRSSETPYGWFSYDDVGARVHVELTSNMALAIEAIGRSPRGVGDTGARGLFPAGRTNMSRGIQVGLNHLNTSARPDAVATMILLGDGSPTVTLGGTNPSGCGSANPGACRDPRADTMAQAQAAANAGVIIYTIFVGEASFAQNHALMLQYIADLTDNGRLEGSYTGSRALPTGFGPAFDPAWFRANVSDNYYFASTEAELQEAYDSIFAKIYTRLVR